MKCSPAHHHCSKSHYELVRGYREERERQEIENEIERSYGEFKGHLINFKTWLKGNKCSPQS